MSSRLTVLALVLVSCAAPSAYEPLVCEPGRAGELAFGMHVNGAFFPMPEYEANGNSFLFIDHACNYWVQRYTPFEAHTGTLDSATLAAINADLLTGAWVLVDGEHDESCCDGATSYLARDDVRASLYQGATGSETLEALLAISETWTTRLIAQATPIVGGRVRLELDVLSGSGDTPPIAWPLSRPLADVLGGATRLATVFEGADAEVLRATRSGVFRDGSITARFLVVDTIPFADAAGCLRPIGGPACR